MFLEHRTGHPTYLFKDGEREFYECVKNILKDYTEKNEIQYQPLKSYFSINRYGSIWRWIIRFKKTKNRMMICFPLDNYTNNEWIEIERLDDLYDMKDRLVSSLRMASFKSTRQEMNKHEKTTNTPHV